MHTPRVFLAIVFAICLALGGFAAAETPAKTTTIQIPTMECAGCAKKVAKTLMAIDGVGSVEPDVEKHLVVVTPKSGGAPSPKAMWEALEKAKYPAKKLEGPDGAFDEKPKK